GNLCVWPSARARSDISPPIFYAPLFACAQPARHGHVEDSPAALETVRSVIDSVHGDVDCATGQVVVSRTAGCGRRCSLRESSEGKDVTAAREGQLSDRL